MSASGGIITMMLTGKAVAVSGMESTYYFQTDLPGMPGKLSDANDTVVCTIDCTLIMETCSISEAISQNLRFPGQYYDEESGLNYNWHRYYKPDWGRYVEGDPILQQMVMLKFDHTYVPMPEDMLYESNYMENKIFMIPEMIRNPEEFNAYVYVMGNPLKNVDLWGLKVMCDLLKSPFGIFSVCCDCPKQAINFEVYSPYIALKWIFCRGYHCRDIIFGLMNYDPVCYVLNCQHIRILPAKPKVCSHSRAFPM